MRNLNAGIYEREAHNLLVNTCTFFILCTN